MSNREFHKKRRLYLNLLREYWRSVLSNDYERSSHFYDALFALSSGDISQRTTTKNRRSRFSPGVLTAIFTAVVTIMVIALGLTVIEKEDAVSVSLNINIVEAIVGAAIAFSSILFATTFYSRYDGDNNSGSPLPGGDSGPDGPTDDRPLNPFFPLPPTPEEVLPFDERIKETF